ncbi:MAG: TIGR00730 family Rossman fold protein, partial [Planctomycetota bacterium]
MQICVYLSASLEAPRPYFETARAVGRRIGTGGHGLVYGGGNIGTMEEVARGAKETGAS